MKYDYIMWDFNGTILDDAHLCLDILNKMLLERNLKIVNMKEYREVFGFPVQEYYKKVGFDFDIEPFEVTAIEFIEAYQSASLFCSLVPGSLETIKEINKMGYKQIILSASEKNNLLQQLNHFELTGYFETVLGIDNIHAKSKVSIGERWIKGLDIDNPRLLMIGDSIHDYEVASMLNADCILVAQGHQSKERLEKTGCPVYDSALEILKTL